MLRCSFTNRGAQYPGTDQGGLSYQADTHSTLLTNSFARCASNGIEEIRPWRWSPGGKIFVLYIENTSVIINKDGMEIYENSVIVSSKLS